MIAQRITAVAAALLFSSACGACGDDEPVDVSGGDGTPEVREIVLAAPPDEAGRPRLFGARQPSLHDVLDQIDAARESADAKGLFLRVGPLGGAWGRGADVREALARVRDANKPIHCHFDMADNSAYLLLVSACDRISMTPAGDLDLVGPAAHVFYARSLLAQIGVRADLMQIGRFKGAADPFTRDDMPEETRESVGAILDDLHGALVRAIVERRRVTEARARQIVDGGPYDADQARAAGLIDDVAFDDEAREHARRAASAPRVREIDLGGPAEPMGLADLLSALAGDAPATTPDGARIALVHLEGTIVDSEEDGMSDARSGPFVAAMRRLANDRDVKAVVLRIDSPGGSALASDRMWHAVRSVAKKKPVIASIGDMAASGGYYVASAASEIIAHDESLVGSIGVVGGKVTFDELAARAGVHVIVMQRGRNAAWASPARAFTDEERAVLEGRLRRTYHRFLSRVSAGRNMPTARVAAGAEGRLMTGRRARELGLVDRAGGLEAAIARALERAGLPDDAPIERWPAERTMLDAIAEAVGGGDRAEAVGLVERLAAMAGPVGEAALLPSLLLGREHAAVALPFVLRIE